MASLREGEILGQGASEERGEEARSSIFAGAIAISGAYPPPATNFCVLPISDHFLLDGVDLVKTTLGPKGMDKILQSLGREGEVTVTNDGATILKSLFVDNPAAKVLIECSKTQDDEVGDGTTSVTVLAGELLREAERLCTEAKLHPQLISHGWRRAADAAFAALEKAAKDHGADAARFREDLLAVARTTLSSKILSQEREHFAQLAVDAVLRLKGSTNLEAIHIIKKRGGALRDSFLDEGFILQKKIGVGQPKRVENAKVLVANTAMDTDKIKIFGSRVRVDSAAKVAEIEQAERQRMLTKCQKIVDHGCNVFINRQLIYNLPEMFFADKGVMAIEHADFDGMERLALVLGAEIVSTFDHPELVKLGTCKLIEEIMLGEEKVIINPCPSFCSFCLAVAHVTFCFYSS